MRGIEAQSARVWLRWTLAVLVLLSAGALYQLASPIIQSGVIFTSWKWQLGVGVGIFVIVLMAGVFAATWTWFGGALLGWLDIGDRFLRNHRRVTQFLLLITTVLFPILTMGPTGRLFQTPFARLLLLWCLAVTGASYLRGLSLAAGWGVGLASSGLLFASVHLALSYLPDISTYPLAMGWSETSRYYYGSLFFSESIYGISTPPSVLHPSRYLLQSLPYLIPNSPLWLHRLWQVCLWIGLTFISAFLLARRLSIQTPLKRWLVVLWVFLFLFQGPILYHLLVCVILILWGFDSRRFWPSLAVVLVASAWAGISRVNWIPIPGFLAATIYFLEIQVGEDRLQRYLIKPVLWVLSGSLVGLLSQTAYIYLSGNEANQFGSSFTSQLLWYRLLPNPTYPMGVIPAIGLVSLPLLALTLSHLFRYGYKYHPIRLLGLGGMLLVLLVGGIVVSTKIGGGSNLHNVDSYLILLAVIGSYIYFHKFSTETAGEGLVHPPGWVIPVLILLVPLWMAINNGDSYSSPDFKTAEKAIATLRTYVNPVREQGHDVLFISQRHLLTFKQIENVPLVPDYEKVFLMEMVMGGNMTYLEVFHEDLENQRFGLIVTDPLSVRLQGRDHSFGEENDAWAQQVSVPVLCHYEPVETIKKPALQILRPRAETPDCP